MLRIIIFLLKMRYLCYTTHKIISVLYFWSYLGEFSFKKMGKHKHFVKKTIIFVTILKERLKPFNILHIF